MPTTSAQLLEFARAMQWMRNAIIEFTSITRTLSGFFDNVYTFASKRAKSASSCVQLLNVSWSSTEAESFVKWKQAFEQQFTLAYQDPSRRICVCTDASDLVWSSVVTHVPHEVLPLPHIDQHHQPLAFSSGRFIGLQHGWSTLEKKAFVIMATVDRMHWITATADGFDLFTDHNNLVFLFDPLAIVPGLVRRPYETSIDGRSS